MSKAVTVQGRYPCSQVAVVTPERMLATSRVGDGFIELRLDDMDNADFWLSVRISDDQLCEWRKQIDTRAWREVLEGPDSDLDEAEGA